MRTNNKLIKILLILLIICLCKSLVYGAASDKDKVKDKPKKKADSLSNELILQKYISDYSSKLEQIQQNTDNFIKDIKHIQNAGTLNINEHNKKIKIIINQIIDNEEKFNNLLQKNQKELIKNQNNIIKKSLNSLKNQIDALDKNFDNISKEELFKSVKKIENEIDKIYRQYRAIQWILFEQ